MHGLISTYGFAVVPVGHSACASPDCGAAPVSHPWTYTVGLMAAVQPELVVMGLCPTDADHVVHRLADRRRQGERLPVDEPIDVDGVPVRLRDVPDEWLQYDPSRMAWWFAWNRSRDDRFGELPVVQQIVWPDDDGRFPDDPACEWHVVEQQPVLAVDPFSFPEPAVRPVTALTRVAPAPPASPVRRRRAA